MKEPLTTYFFRQTLFVFLLMAGVSINTKASGVSVNVSEMVEFMSILARTAGFKEYCNDNAGKYTKDTEEWFASYKTHPTVQYMQQLRAKYGISYDAVAAMAIHLACADGKQIKFLDYEGELPDERWKPVNLDTFLLKANEFYKETDFHEFFIAHNYFYQQAIDKFKADVLDGFDQSWYSAFYGKHVDDGFNIIIGFTNGPGNYGPHRQLKGKEIEPFAILGFYMKKGELPDFSYFLSTLIHEFNHSYVNGLLTKASANQPRDIGALLLRMSFVSMRRLAYGNRETVLNESLVRAAVILYMMEHHAPIGKQKEEMAEQISCGFLWMPELVAALGKYEKNRKKYKTIDTFAPELIKVLSLYLDKENKRIVEPLNSNDILDVFSTPL